mmetsp:Transcript_29339/g.75632  ORF Transcript_29339/g.75632 Transcript_29339/m.75632 type:complete len:227 (+) Transcript_29339:1480-2160(+)
MDLLNDVLKLGPPLFMLRQASIVLVDDNTLDSVISCDGLAPIAYSIPSCERGERLLSYSMARDVIPRAPSIAMEGWRMSLSFSEKGRVVLWSIMNLSMTGLHLCATFPTFIMNIDTERWPTRRSDSFCISIMRAFRSRSRISSGVSLTGPSCLNSASGLSSSSYCARLIGSLNTSYAFCNAVNLSLAISCISLLCECRSGWYTSDKRLNAARISWSLAFRGKLRME